MFETECCFLFLDVLVERLKVKREAQETKGRAEESKQGAESGSANSAEDSVELPSQAADKAAEAVEDAGSQGKKWFEEVPSSVSVFHSSQLSCALFTHVDAELVTLLGETVSQMFLRQYQEKILHLSLTCWLQKAALTPPAPFALHVVPRQLPFVLLQKRGACQITLPPRTQLDLRQNHLNQTRKHGPPTLGARRAGNLLQGRSREGQVLVSQ